MRKGKSVIGQDIYSVSAGIRVESVKDLVLEDGDDGIIALLVSQGGLLGTSRIVPFASVVRFGPAAVLIDDADSVIPAASDPHVAEILDRKGSVLGTRVVTEEGEDLGRIADMYFDETSGRITGYEVSGGLLGDVMRGTSYLPFEHIRVIGRDAVIASGEAQAIVDGQQGGLTAALDSATASIASHIPSSDGDVEGEGSSDPASHDPDGELVGARAQADLVDRDGSIVIANGQTVTLDLIQRARAENNLDPLYQAVGRARSVPVGEQAVEAASKVADSASDLWARFTGRLSEMTDAAGQRMDTQQTQSRLGKINDAIGRPVTKVFLDRDDSVILDLGDLVTHQAVQRASDAGLLDSLLSCVYVASDVSFTRDEMRAEIAGDSTVDKASGGATVVTDLEARLAPSVDPEEDATPGTPPEESDRAQGKHGGPGRDEEGIDSSPTSDGTNA